MLDFKNSVILWNNNSVGMGEPSFLNQKTRLGFDEAKQWSKTPPQIKFHFFA